MPASQPARPGELGVNRAEVVPNSEDSVTFPRLVPLSGLVVAAAGLLQWLLPIDILSDLAFVEDVDPLWLEVAGLIIALAGLSLSVAGHFALTRRGADVRSRQPATVLVVDGVFQWTRNPGYLGMLIGLVWHRAGAVAGLAADPDRPAVAVSQFGGDRAGRTPPSVQIRQGLSRVRTSRPSLRLRSLKRRRNGSPVVDDDTVIRRRGISGGRRARVAISSVRKHPETRWVTLTSSLP